MNILILGVNGFIGHALARRILVDTDWAVFGMDLESDRVSEHLSHPRFRFLEGDLAINREWIEYHIKKCDVVVPLVAIATPQDYLRRPLDVFELDFEENLRVIRHAVKYSTRVVFPSTSEVYGMCTDKFFNEDTSTLTLGPIAKQRWIYASAKQLLDRVIWAYGKRDGLSFTIFRPFNWIGPNLDDIDTAKEGSSRVVTQFLGHLLRGEAVQLVDGGRQRRCFTFVEDGIDALMRILANTERQADGRIFNIGNPENDVSIAELLALMVDVLAEFEGYEQIHDTAIIEETSGVKYYGSDYQDMMQRIPDISAARKCLGWNPRVGLKDALRCTIKYYVQSSTAPSSSAQRNDPEQLLRATAKTPGATDRPLTNS